MNQTQSYQSSTDSPATSYQNDDLGLRGYTSLKKLGHGSQGDVFLARRDSDSTEVAIKRLNIESVKTWKTYELFHREAEVLSTLDIDGIAKFYEAVDMPEDDPPRAYIVQEFIPGTTLGALIAQGHRFSLGCTYDIIVQLLTLLKQLHSHTPPVIHRDIKPTNIMLKPLENDRYKVYLLDFGAVANPQLQGGGSTVAGTYGFMPPEQLMGKPIPASDVYAIAAVAVNLITGVSPADMPVKDFHLIFEPQMQFMPVNVVNLLRQMLEPNTDNRLCDYDILIDDFKKFRGGNYDTSNEIVQNSSNSDYEYKLKEIESYTQAGNIELWQRLPDATPRPIPAPYLAALKKPNAQNCTSLDELYFQTHSNIYQLHYKDQKQIYKEKYKITFGGFGFIKHYGGGDYLMWGVSILIIIFCVILNAMVDFSETFINTILPFFYLFILILPIVFVFWFRAHLAKKATLRTHKIKHFENGNALNQLRNVLLYGRKTIATVISVEYQNVNDDFCEHNVDTLQYAVHQAPKFSIKYSFNPPDDSDENDLIHEITVDEPPETFLKPGDPLPILYRIYKNSKGIECVDSMPFPVVLKDVETYSGLLGSSAYIGHC